MKIKDLLVPLGFAVLTTFLIQNYFFSSKNDSVKSVSAGQQFTAPTSKQEVKPLNKEIDFVDIPRAVEPVLTTVDTNLATYTFSTEGASLDSAVFKRNVDGGYMSIQTLFPVTETEKEKRCFLVALQEKTPYYFTLKNRVDTDTSVDLLYEAPFEHGVLQKQFTIFKTTHKINVTVRLVSRKKEFEPTEVRLFFPAPRMKDIESRDVVSGVYANESGSVKKTAVGSLDLRAGWFAPALFGADSRYFVHALIADESNFVNRAYFRVLNKKHLTAIVEGPTVHSSAEWKLSFYMGPKEEPALYAVDERLTQTLDYSGILSPVARFMLMLLKYLYKYLGNYGWAIIALTVAMRLVLMPFAFRMHKGMKKQKEFQKKMAHVKRRFKDDPQAQAQAQAALIKEHGLPGLGGCLPLLIQIPVFFALNRVLSSSIELYKAPFLIWSDLSVPDPYYIFPVLVAIGMMSQALTAQEQNQRLMFLGMGLVFGVFSANFAAGLTMYFCVGTLLQLAQSLVQKHLVKGA